MNQEQKATKNTVLYLAVVTVAMFAFGFGLVSLYDVFCRVTGFGGGRGLEATAIEEVRGIATVDLDREIKVRMVTKRGRGVRLYLTAMEDSVAVNPGTLNEVFFRLTNPSDQPRVARAVPSLAPAPIVPYVKKVECFCFDEQPIGPNESIVLSMKFMVDAALPPNYGDDLVVGYTLFEAENAEPIAKIPEDKTDTRS